MSKPILRTLALALLAAALTLQPASALAQTNTNKPAADKKAAVAGKDASSAEKKKSSHPFHGKLAAVDKQARTIKVGQSTYPVAADAKIKKDGKTATLEDGVVGEPVSGYVKLGPDGKLAATSVNFGQPPNAKTAAKPATKDSPSK
jgi:hypothetical protein